MPVEVILPKVDMDMTTGTIATWHVAEGDAVTKGDPLFDIETEKAAMEVEAPGDGTLHHVAFPAGAEVPIGTPVAWIYADGEEVTEPPSQADSAPERPTIETKIPTLEPIQDTPSPSDTIRATPAARRLAREAGLKLDTIDGSGPRGRIQSADIQAILDSAPARPASQPGALHIQTTGTGDALPWLMLHGFAAEAAQWDALASHLGRTAPIHRIDLPNHGRSPHRAVTDFADLTSQIRTAFDTLGDTP
ncbi:MAG: biotin/lipoyl-containing protein, partial [Pseudomonadota bacterium]